MSNASDWLEQAAESDLEDGADRWEVAAQYMPLAETLGNVEGLERAFREAGRGADAVADTRNYANSANVEWREPIPLGPGDPDPYPVDALPRWVREHVESVSDHTQTPTDLPFLLALSSLSVAAANKVRVQVRPGHREPGHLWTATVLPPGSRKSPVFRLMARPVFDYEEDEADRIAPERRRLQDEREVLEKALERAKRDAAKASGDDAFGEARERMHELRERLERLDVPPSPRLVASDVTSEKLARLMAGNGGRIAILAPEGDLFRIMAGRYSGGVSFDHYKRSWTGDEPLRDDRMGREGSHVRRPAVTMGLCLQPSVLETLEAKEAFRGEGLLARFLYAVPDSGIGDRLTGADVPGLDEGAARRYGDQLRRLLDTAPRDVDDGGEFIPHELKMEPGAVDALFAFEGEVEAMLAPGGDLEHVRDWGAKLAGHVTRVAVLLHVAHRAGERVNPWGAPVTAGAMEAAVRIGRAAVPHALQVFDVLETDTDTALARYTLRRIRSATGPDGKPPTKKNLFDKVKGKVGLGTVDELDGVLGTLEAHRLVRVVPRGTNGAGRPPSPWVVLHPSRAHTDHDGHSHNSQNPPRGGAAPPGEPNSANSANVERGGRHETIGSVTPPSGAASNGDGEVLL